jgi:hypothetical protein
MRCARQRQVCASCALPAMLLWRLQVLLQLPARHAQQAA